MAGKINPYDYEPEYSDDEDTGNVDKCEISNAADVVSDCSEGNYPLAYLDNRVGKPPTYWCQCGKCQSMDSGLECQCCLELDRVQEKMNNIDEKEACISSSDRFSRVCMDQDVIYITLLMIHDALNKGPLPNPIPNRLVLIHLCSF